MKKTLLKVILTFIFAAGLLLHSSVLHAQKLNEETVTVDPMPPLGSFNDFEEMRWKGEVEDVLAKASEIESQGRNELKYKAFGMINLALAGNAYAAAYLTGGSGFRIYVEYLIDDQKTLLGDVKNWRTYADELTSPGWANYVADIKTGTELKRSRKGPHPAGIYWNARFNEYSWGALSVFKSAYMGYAYAQADLAAAYSMPGSSWIDSEDPLPDDRNERFLALEKASAEQGEPYGLYATGHSYNSGLHGKKDPETALMYYRLAYLAIQQNLRPGALTYSVLRDDSEFMYGIREAVMKIKPSKEMTARAETRADEWLAEFMKKREVAYSPVRTKRAQLAAAMREKYRDEYIRVYDILKKEGIDLPPNLFDSGGL